MSNLLTVPNVIIFWLLGISEPIKEIQEESSFPISVLVAVQITSKLLYIYTTTNILLFIIIFPLEVHSRKPNGGLCRVIISRRHLDAVF